MHSSPSIPPKPGPPVFGPRSFGMAPPGLNYPVEFPPGRPMPNNLQAICLHADHRPRYPDTYFPASGFGQLKRRALAVNLAESLFSDCCAANQTRGQDLTLCCVKQAVSILKVLHWWNNLLFPGSFLIQVPIDLTCKSRFVVGHLPYQENTWYASNN